MEVQFMEHIRHSLLIDKNKDLIIEKLLNLTLEIICLLTREDFIVVRKSDDHVTDDSSPPAPDTWTRTQSPITEAPPHAPIVERNRDGMVLEPAEIFHGETEKVPGKSKDVEVSFSMTEWDYSGPEDVVVDTRQPHGSVGECSSRDPPERCETPLYPPDCIKEEIRIITRDYQVEPGHGLFHPQCKEEETVPDPISTGGCSSRNPPERCETPVYSPDCIEEKNRIITQDYRAEPGNGIFRCKEEAVPAEISSGGDTGTEPDAADYRGPQEFPCIGPPVSSHYPDKMHQCLACQRYFPNRSALVTHQKTHSAINLFSCSICGVCFDSKLLFTAHQQFHMEEKSFDCSQCGKSFNRKSRLLSHKRTHTGEKPFSCPECGRCFAERSALVTHKRIHSGEKPFNCKECGKRFVQGSSLMKHQRIHTGERPFVCFQCGRSFSDSSNLFRHQRIHSREKSFMS